MQLLKNRIIVWTQSIHNVQILFLFHFIIISIIMVALNFIK